MKKRSTNSDLTRRNFLQIAMGAGAILGLSCRSEAQQAPSSDFRPPTVTLGNTGVATSMLGIGTGTNGWGGRSDQTALGTQAFVDLLQYSYDRGIRYFDLADQYGSHSYMRRALTSGGGTIPRDDVMLLTKTHSSSSAEMRKDLDRFRQEIGTDQLDVVLLHCETSGDWNRSHAGAMEVLSEAKEKGIIKAHGVSCHSLSALKTAAAEPWVDVDLARYNPWASRMDSSVSDVTAVLEQMKENGKAIIGMKVLGGSTHTSSANKDESLAFSMNSPLIDIFTIGMRSRGEVDDLLSRMEKILQSRPVPLG